MSTQSFANHTRWHAPFHFFVVPVLIINFIWSVVDLIRGPGWYSARFAAVSIALIVLATLVRLNPLRAQDRLIRLEERLRCQRVLSPTMAAQAQNLSEPQFIALRFAPDEELEEIVGAIVAGKLSKPVDIKKAIKNWRADTFRV